VATQLVGEEGQALTNVAERLVEAVWKRHCPEWNEPPIWIGYQIIDGVEPELPLTSFEFDVVGPFAVATPPLWGPPLAFHELAKLVGQNVDEDRGTGYLPTSDPAASQELLFEAVPLSDLPTPRLNGEPPCMPGTQTEWTGARDRSSHREPTRPMMRVIVRNDSERWCRT
jgi:hypothetical protein